MSAEDPTQTLIGLLSDETDGVSLKKDDDTDATVGFVEAFKRDFYNEYDVMIAVAFEPPSTEKMLGGIGSSAMKEVTANYAVSIWTRTKTGITGRDMLWKAVKEVKRVIGENAKAPGGILKWMRVSSRKGQPKLSLNPPFFGTVVLVETHRVTSLENP